MKKILAMLGLALLVSAPAHATPVLLGEVFRDYGSAPGKIDPAGNDVLGGNFVTISDQSTSRFSDVFNFGGFGLSSISHFELTLNFSQTLTSGAIFPNSWFENWNVRPGNSTSLFEMTRANGLTTQSFTIDSSVDTFFASVSSGVFNLWFAEETLGADSFRLYDAKLSVYGTAVPEPGTLALLGLGAIGLAVSRRRRL